MIVQGGECNGPLLSIHSDDDGHDDGDDDDELTMSLCLQL